MNRIITKTNVRSVRLMLCGLLMLIQSAAMAQKKTPVEKPDSLAEKVAKQLSISKAKAKELRTAYNYKSDEIQKLMKDTLMKPVVRQQKLNQLLQERRNQLQTIVGPALLDTLKSRDKDTFARSAERRKQQQERHQAEMNKVPHEHKKGVSKTDSIKTKTNLKPKTKLQ